MYKVTANDWDGMGLNRVKMSVRNTRVNNERMREVAERYASRGRSNPSPLEKLMMEFLGSHHVRYEFQKPCCIYKDGVITQFFIVDFYVPSKGIVIETDGKCHDAQAEYDEYRTKMIRGQHPGVKVIRWRFKDFHSPGKLRDLLRQLC